MVEGCPHLRKAPNPHPQVSSTNTDDLAMQVSQGSHGTDLDSLQYLKAWHIDAWLIWLPFSDGKFKWIFFNENYPILMNSSFKCYQASIHYLK